MKQIIISITIALSVLLFTSCNDKLNVQQDFDFTLTSWYLQKNIAVGEEVEIRFTLNRSGDWKGAEYSFGYVQLSGDGVVEDIDHNRLKDRETYPLNSIPGLLDSDPLAQTFTLYYLCLSEVRTELKFIVTDNFGIERVLMVDFYPDTTTQKK